MRPEPENITLEDMDQAPGAVPGTEDQADSEFDILRREFARVSDEKANLELELDRLKRANRATEILDGLIEPFADRTFYFMCYYCAFVGFVIILHVSGWATKDLPESALQVLVGSTAATVIGLVGMVLTGIFVGARKKAG